MTNNIVQFSKAPWNPKQIKALIRRQEDVLKPPYTCIDCGSKLIPIRDGWFCECGHVQDWAYEADMKG
jgi:hypothetical protein